MSAVVPAPGSGRAGVGRRVLPGFGPSLGFTLTYLSLLVLIPLAGVFLRASHMSGAAFVEAVSNTRALAAYKLTFGASAARERVADQHPGHQQAEHRIERRGGRRRPERQFVRR